MLISPQTQTMNCAVFQCKKCLHIVGDTSFIVDVSEEIKVDENDIYFEGLFDRLKSCFVFSTVLLIEIPLVLPKSLIIESDLKRYQNHKQV